jgi:ABC-type transport system involved in multi-copper enzyme maturation permease subunit
VSAVDAPFPLRPLARLGAVVAWSLRRTLRTRKFLITGLVAVGGAAGLTLLAGAHAQDPTFEFWTALDEAFLAVGVPLVALALIAGGFGEEIQDQTLVYLLVRPVSRTTAFVGRYAGGALAGSVVAAAMVGVATLVSPARIGIGTVLLISAIAAFGAVTVGALYYALAALFRRGLVAGLIYTFVVEGLFQSIPGSTRKLSILHHVRSLFHHATDDDFVPLSPEIAEAVRKAAETARAPIASLGDAVEPWTSVPTAIVVCAIVIVGSLGLGSYLIRRRDFALKE